MHGIVYAKGATFFQSAKNIPVLLLLFFPRRGLNIQRISACHVSNERKLIVDQI